MLRRTPGSGRGSQILNAIGVAIVAMMAFVPVAASAASYPPVFPRTDVSGQWSTLVPAGNTSPNLYNIACPTTAICYAVGQKGTIETGSSSSAWTTLSSGTMLDLFGIACPGPTTCYAVGGTTGSGVIVGTTKAKPKWHVVLATKQPLHGVGCWRSSTCIAVGDNGLVLRTTNGGAKWNVVKSNTFAAIYAVSCPAGTTACLAVGFGGNYLVSSDAGATWTAGSSGTSIDFGSVWCSPTVHCLAGSGSGIWSVTNNGSTWVQVLDSAGYQVSCISTTACAFAAGLGAQTTTNDGQTWVTQLTSPPDSFFGLACRSATNCYAVGESGIVAHSVVAFATSSPPPISITTYLPITPNSFPQAVVAGPDGAMWATEFRGNAILRISSTGVEQEFALPTPGSQPEGIAAGPDGALWFTEDGTGRIGRITTAGSISEYPITDWTCSSCNMPDIVAGPDGAMWFTELQADKIGRITTPGAITEYALPPAMTPEHIVSGPDGNLWFAGYENTVNRMTTSGVLTSFAVPSNGGGGLVGITLGPDGNFWFTATIGSWVGVMTTAGTLLAQYTVHPSIQGIATISPGPDGALWFADVQTIDRITLSGVLTEYPAVGESWVTEGPGRTSLWYASFASSQLGRVTSASW